MGNKSTFHRLPLLGLLTLMCASTACTPTPPSRVWVRAGTLIDGFNALTQTAMRIEINDGLITAVHPDDNAAPPPDTAVIDARDLTVLPGLIDAHVHLLLSPACHPGRDMGLRQATRNLQAYGAGGVTTVADLAAPLRVAVGMRRYVGTARHRGPRVLVAGPMLTAVNGYPVGIDDTLGLRKTGMVRELTDAASARTAVMDLVDGGADVVKLTLQQTSFDGRPLPLLAENTVCAVVQEAHRQRLRVLAHATETVSVARAVHCGVDVVAHGSAEPLPDALVRDMATKGTIVLPTHRVFECLTEDAHTLNTRLQHVDWAVAPASRLDLQHYAEAVRNQEQSGKTSQLPDFFGALMPRDALVQGAQTRMANTKQLRDARVSLGLGTDSAFCFNWAGSPAEELQRLVDTGFTPMQALQVATAGSARALGLQDAVGLVRPGYRADIIAVEGAPHKDVRDVQHVRYVLMEGVAQHFAEPAWYQPMLLFVEILLTKLRGH